VKFGLKSFSWNPVLTFLRQLIILNHWKLLHGILNPKLLLRWPTLVIQSEVTAETYSLPRMINLSWSQARTLRKIFQRSYMF